MTSDHSNTLPHVYQNRFEKGRWISLLTPSLTDSNDTYSNIQTPYGWYKKLTDVRTNSPYSAEQSYRPQKAIKEIDRMIQDEHKSSNPMPYTIPSSKVK